MTSILLPPAPLNVIEGLKLTVCCDGDVEMEIVLSLNVSFFGSMLVLDVKPKVVEFC